MNNNTVRTGDRRPFPLDADWEAFRRSRQARLALERWAVAHPDLRADTLEALRRQVWAAPVAEADRSLAALAQEIAGGDRVAARMLLHCLRPGLAVLTVQHTCPGDDPVEVQLAMLSHAWVRIATYPYARRPTKIAANVLLDVRKAYRRSRWARGQEIPMDGPGLARAVAGRGGRADHAPSAEHDALDHLPEPDVSHHLARAVAGGVVTEASARLLWRLRVAQEDPAAVAAEAGVTRCAVQRRCRRVTTALHQAWAESSEAAA